MEMKLLSLTDIAHSTGAHIGNTIISPLSNFTRFPPSQWIDVTMRGLKPFIPSDANKPMASGASHDTSLPQWPDYTFSSACGRSQQQLTCIRWQDSVYLSLQQHSHAVMFKIGETWWMERFPFCFSPLTCSDPWAPRVSGGGGKGAGVQEDL